MVARSTSKAYSSSRSGGRSSRSAAGVVVADGARASASVGVGGVCASMVAVLGVRLALGVRLMVVLWHGSTWAILAGVWLGLVVGVWLRLWCGVWLWSLCAVWGW